jgi:DNA-binding transcriptional ArsR family regulator
VTVRRLEIDATTLKALAHPLRVQILRVLELRERASVTSLAGELGETTAAVSYHLRQLARHGLVEESTDGPGTDEHAVGRRPRWWRMAVDEIHLDAVALTRSADTREAFDFLAREAGASRSRRLAHWFATAPTWPEEWQRAATELDAPLTLDPAQTRALADDLKALVDRYRALPPGEGARRVDVQYAVYPAADREPS